MSWNWTVKSGQKGVTLMELVFVMIIVGILSIIAVPSFMQWRQSVDKRASARGVSMMLRDARAKAITQNVQYGVEIDIPNKRYRMRKGNLAYGSNWANEALCPPQGNWVDIPEAVSIAMININTSDINGIAFFPNGTSTIDPNKNDLAWIEVQGQKIKVYNIGTMKIE